jgi:diadenosine tetraphosphate (Ap4A) HIT family hydrolase
METGVDCCLCGQIRGDAQSDLIARLLPGRPYARRVILETSAFAVIPSLGPLADGHVLLCPKTHVRGFAALGRAVQIDYLDAKARLTERLAAEYGPMLYAFEHGMSIEGGHVICSTEHAHMHFVPFQPSLPATWLDADVWTVFDGSLAALERITGGNEYLLYESPSGVSYVAAAHDRRFQSQHMRQALAAAMKTGTHWDWRHAPDAEAADRTWRRCTGTAAP